MIQEVWTLLSERASFFLGLCGEHLAISLIAIIIAVLIGGALGIFMSEYQKSARLVMPIVNFLYTIPSISMLGFLIPLSGIGNPDRPSSRSRCMHCCRWSGAPIPD